MNQLDTVPSVPLVLISAVFPFDCCEGECLREGRFEEQCVGRPWQTCEGAQLRRLRRLLLVGLGGWYECSYDD